MFLCLHFHNYVGISQLAFQGRPVLTLSLVHPAHEALSALTSLPQAFCWELWDSAGQDRPSCLLPEAHALLLLASWTGLFLCRDSTTGCLWMGPRPALRPVSGTFGCLVA